MNAKQLIAGLILLLTSLGINAQSAPPPPTASFTIKGILLDSLTNESEPYATLRIVPKSNPQHTVKMAVTGTNGKFQEKLQAPHGDYVLTLSSVGKNTVKREFSVGNATTTIDLGTLLTREATEELKGVEVIAQKPLVKVDMDKIEYNIEDDPDSKSSNVLDMLRKVPLVTVDGEDKVQVNGSTRFKIHVNGKPNNMMSNNPTEVLKSMPANTIKYIEVITEPGVKYDAEGVGGILNIVTIGTGMQGYTATFNTSVSNRGLAAGAYATAQVKKFTITGNYSYNHNDQPRSYSENYRESYDDATNNRLYNNGSNKSDGNFQYGNLEGSYEIDTLRLITFSGNMYGGNFDGYGHNVSQMLNTDGERTYQYRTNMKNTFSYYYIGASADYQRSFKKKGELFTFSYRLNNNPRQDESLITYSEIFGYPQTLAGMLTAQEANTVEHTFQADYVNPLTKKHEIETGVKYIIRDSRSDSRYTAIDNAAINELPDDIKYDHLQDILAAYAGYRLRLSKFSLKAGLRYEHTFLRAHYKQRPESNFKKEFDDLVPSVNLSYQLAQAKTLRLSYNNRISRPGIWHLSPYVNRNNPDNITYGNPELTSEKSHSVGINFNSFSRKINMDIGLRHTFANNSIERYSFFDTDEYEGIVRDNVLHNTYRNMGKRNNTRFSLYFNWNIGPKTRFYVNGGANYTDIESKALDIANSGFTFNCYGGFQHTLPWKLRLSINGGGSSRYITSQGNNSGYYYYSLGLNRQFLKDRLTLSVNTSNPFEKYRTFENKATTAHFFSHSRNDYPARHIGFNISYRIGELKASVKKVARSIQNDDVKGEGDGNGNGSGAGKN